MSKAEGDAALAPLLNYSVSDTDIANLKDFIKHGANGDFADARTAMQKMANSRSRNSRSGIPIAPRRRNDARANPAFLDDNPLWPSPKLWRKASRTPCSGAKANRAGP